MNFARTTELPQVRAILAAADEEWNDHAPDDWTRVDFWTWPRGFHRSAWTIAGHIGWNPLDTLDDPPPAARAVNVLITRACIAFAAVMTRHIEPPDDAHEPLLAWFNAAVDEYRYDLAGMVEGIGDVDWGLPASRRWAARRLVRMWDKGGAGAFSDLTATLRWRSPIDLPNQGGDIPHTFR